MVRKQRWPEPPPGHSLWAYLVTVLSVYDGDTLIVSIDRGWDDHSTKRLRLMVADADEMNDADAAVRARAVVARDRVRALLPVECLCIAITTKPKHKDQYGRFLARVFVPGGERAGEEVGALLVSEGLARPYGRGTR